MYMSAPTDMTKKPALWNGIFILGVNVACEICLPCNYTYVCVWLCETRTYGTYYKVTDVPIVARAE